MAYNFEEEEQLADIKAWWNKYGTFIMTVITVVALAVAAWRLWGWYQERQAMSAASAYQILTEAAEKKDMSRVKIASQAVLNDYGSTIYGPMAALIAARAYFDSKDLDAARDTLQWAVTNAAGTEFEPVARLRLAAVLLDQNAAEKGLEVLKAPTVESFEAPFAERRGDLLAALGRNDEAIKSFEEALAKLGPRSQLTRLVQLKLDALKASVGS